MGKRGPHLANAIFMCVFGMNAQFFAECHDGNASPHVLTYPIKGADAKVSENDPKTADAAVHFFGHFRLRGRQVFDRDKKKDSS